VAEMFTVCRKDDHFYSMIYLYILWIKGLGLALNFNLI